MEIKIIGSKIHYLKQIDSTNNYLADKIKQKDIIEGEVIMTEYQTGGKGQKGNVWESEKNQNLLFSVYIKPRFLVAHEQFMLNKLVSISLVEYIQDIGLSASIKWPNDILIEHHKVCGILIENILKGSNIEHTILGIGLNVNQKKFFFDYLNKKSLYPASIYFFSKKAMNLNDELLKILEFLNKNYLLCMQNKEIIDALYIKYLYKLNEWSFYEYKGHKMTARILGVDTNGKLQLESLNGFLDVDFKEIIFLR